MATDVVVVLILSAFVALSASQNDMPLENDAPACCEDICKKTYPPHTYDKPDHEESCERGCRLFTIIDFIEETSDVNATRESCAYSCHDAYAEEDMRAACVVGCGTQTPMFPSRFSQMERLLAPLQEVDEPFLPLLYPLQSAYSNMVDKINSYMTMSWSFYVQGQDGKLIVVKSAAPRVIEYGFQPEGEYKTSNYLETNLEAVDNSATPNLRNSQLHVVSRDLGRQGDNQATDFLGCISRKTGLSHMLLSVTIFVSALVMIWLCISSAVTAPDHHVPATPAPPPPQKLSIFGDLEYLKETTAKERAWLMAAVSAQEKNTNAKPLPIKIQVNRV